MRPQAGPNSDEKAFCAYLEREAREAFAKVAQRLTEDLIEHGKSQEEAKLSGAYMARLHFLNRFRHEHPGTCRDGFERLASPQLREGFGK